jgi:uncharacterized protein YjbJ (UPF0337 family)
METTQMNDDKVKGALQKAGGHVEEAAGALVGDENLKLAGKEDQIKGEAREAWGNVKDAGDALIDRARAAKADAELKSARANAFEREHAVEVTNPKPPSPAKPAGDSAGEAKRSPGNK